MKNFALLLAVTALTVPGVALATPSKETRVVTTQKAPEPVVQTVYVERVVERVVEVPAPAVTRTSDNFTGWRAGASVGVTNVENESNVSYSVIGGYDAPIGDRFTAGLDVEVRDFAEDHIAVGVGARIGYAATDKVLPFARVGYSSVDVNNDELSLSGVEVGGGIEFAVTDRLTIAPEYRYTDFNNGRDGAHGARVGVNFRF